MDFDANGIKLKLSGLYIDIVIASKDFIAATLKMAAKNASLHTYGVRSMFSRMIHDKKVSTWKCT